MPTVLRWGQSAYESDLDLAMERAGAEALDLDWTSIPETARPDLTGVDVLVVTSRVRVDAEILARFEGTMVLTTTSGWDHIDVSAARAAGVAVGRCPLARRDPVVEHALGSLLGLLRGAPALQRAAQRGRWARGDLPALAPRSLAGSRIGVVGLGVIGRRMAEVLDGLGAEVWGVDPRGWPGGGKVVALDDALPQIDGLTLHCALTPTSRGLIDAARIDRLRPGTVVVNTARGGILDVDAAVAAVGTGHLGGIAVDVFPEEPWPGLRAAASDPRVWLTPHSAGYDRGLGGRVAAEVIAALGSWVAGRPLPHLIGGGD